MAESYAAAAAAGGGELRLQMPAPHHRADGRLGGEADTTPTPERQLSCFVRTVAMIERVGNALGTLAFTWATVVLLGGYPTALQPDKDFWIATAIVFLEAARMFSRNNRMDYQLVFGTRGAFRPLGWNGLVVIVCFTDLVSLLHLGIFRSTVAFMVYLSFLVLLFLFVAGLFYPGVVRLRLGACNPLRRAVSLWSPVLAILLLGPSVPGVQYVVLNTHGSYIVTNSPVKWAVYGALLVLALLLTVSEMKLPSIIRLADRTLGRRQLLWRRLVLNLCMVGAIVILVRPSQEIFSMFVIIITQASILAFLSIGNLQIPAAIARVLLASWRLAQQNYYGDDNTKKDDPDKTNLGPSMIIFYGTVLGQGALYIAACVVEVFSFFPRTSLIRRGGFKGQWGVESVDLYYAYAFGKCTEGGMLAPNKISIVTFAMDSLNSEASKNQGYGVRMLHSLLQREPTKTRLLSKLSISTKTIARLITLLDCKTPRYGAVRLYAAKVTAELAKSLHLRAVTFPGLIEVVSGLLDCGYQRNNRGNNLLLVDMNDGELVWYATADNTHDGGQNAIPSSANNLQETQQGEQVGIAEHNSRMLRCWRKMLECWSVPKEEPLADHDLLPALGMSILDSLAYSDQSNCAEISRATDLIPKIIGLTSYRAETMYTDAQQVVMVKSSLSLLHRLSGIDGEIGVTLRHKISEHLFLLRNLANTLGDRRSNQGLKKSVAGIIRNLAVNGSTRHEIGQIQVIITMLLRAFVSPAGPSSTDDDLSLKKVAGQALSMLAMESVDNCLAMLRETGCSAFVKELTTMISDDRYRCVAASLLRNMCLLAPSVLIDSDLKELSYSLHEVLARIMDDAEGAELEILIGLSSQICRVIPGDFDRELDHGDTKGRFVKRLIDALNNANMEPSSAPCSGIRQVILEQALSMTGHDSRYANYFCDRGMMEALLMVEKTISKAEGYRIILGDAGLMEYDESLASLVAKVKQLLAARAA